MKPMKNLPSNIFSLWIIIIFIISACETSHSQVEMDAGEIGDQLLLATTTSTYDSGLLDKLLPVFEDATGVQVKIISVGSGQALSMGEKGEADVLLVHAPSEEEKLEEQGTVINRHRVMHNDYVLLGPDKDIAAFKDKSITEALFAIHQKNVPFYSRGDDSGTHYLELDLWEQAGISPSFDTYQETGQGMGETLRISAEKEGYVITDRGSYLYLQNRLAPISILVEGDDALANIYHVMQVNPKLSKQINEEAAKAFVDYLLKEETQDLINNYGVEEWGEPLFFSSKTDQ
ncbi:substrate-binding domain-containing protein [Salipaludibacillus sp. HK11]|uniref:substrate-binding domain-containing protein n=1 Tax=Salipaludibacillus sp. HK11 TaxID=3394320 RepID=UPI0039FC5B21